MFLTSASVDLVRRRAADLPRLPPLDPLKALIDDFLYRGGAQEDFIDGVKLQGASAMHERLIAGASALGL